MAIGDTRPSRQLLTPFQPRVSERDFGVDVADALGRLGTTFEQAARDFGEREEKTKRYAALEALSRVNGEMDREFADLVEKSPATGEGMLRTVRDWSQKRKKQFLDSIDPALREEFSSRFEPIAQSFMTGGAQAQLGKQKGFFETTFNEQLTAAATDLQVNPGNLSRWRGHLTELIQAAPLSQSEKIAAAQSANRMMLEFMFRGEQENFYTANEYDDSTLVARIIGLESSGDPDAENPSELSDAAGLGQFIPSTWLRMVKKYRPDIAEGKSDDEIIAMRKGKATADLQVEMAERYIAEVQNHLTISGFDSSPGNTYLGYFAGEGGVVTILSADPSTPIKQLMSERAVAANAAITFNGKSFAEFTAADIQAWARHKMAGVPREAGVRQAAEPLSIWEDPRYASLPVDQKLRLDEDARITANRRQAAAEAAEKARLEDNYNELAFAVDSGDAGESEVYAARIAGDISLEQNDKLMGRLDGYKTGVSRLRRTQRNLDDPEFIFDPSNKEHVADLDAVVWGTQGEQLLRNRDEDYARNVLIPMADKGIVPPRASRVLSRMMSSRNMDDVVYASQAIRMLFETNPGFSSDLSDETIQEAFFVSSYAEYAGEGETFKLITDRRDPQKRKLFEDLRAKGVEEAAKLEMDDFTGEIPTTITGATQFLVDARNLFSVEFARSGGDADYALDATEKLLELHWGEFKGEYMKHPPDKMGLPKINLRIKDAAEIFGVTDRRALTGYDWMDVYAKQTLGLPDDAEIFYLAAPNTAAAKGTGAPVPYIVLYRQEGFTDRVPALTPVYFKVPQETMLEILRRRTGRFDTMTEPQ